MFATQLIQICSQDLTQLPAWSGVTAIFASFVIYIIANEVVRHRKRISTFPGPSGLPLIGNLHQIQSNAAQKYREWARIYGPVYQVQMGNVPILVVNSAKAAKVVFGNNSHATASRPEFYTFHKLVSNTAGTTIGTSPYSESLKRRRKGAASALNRPSIESYVRHLDLETKDFIQEILKYGSAGKVAVDPLPMVQRLSLSLALTLNWGVRMPTHDSDLFREITYVEVEISRFRSTTDNLQDYIPFLRLNPFSFGTRKAAKMRQRRDCYLSKLNKDLEDRVAKKIHKPCIQANVMLDTETRLDNVELTISLTMLSGGFETFSTVTSWAIALLATRPDIQEKALESIQEIYNEQMPLCDATDDQKCGYIIAFVRESLRFFTVLRLSLPRATNKEFVYEGKTVPVGTVMFLNSWACNMDDELWEDPEVFRPERFLERPEAPIFTFGVGYRMCAGSLLADRELYLTFLRMLASFKISATDTVDVDPLSGVADITSLVSTPKAYQVVFTPLNETALVAALQQHG